MPRGGRGGREAPASTIAMRPTTSTLPCPFAFHLCYLASYHGPPIVRNLAEAWSCEGNGKSSSEDEVGSDCAMLQKVHNSVLMLSTDVTWLLKGPRCADAVPQKQGREHIKPIEGSDGHDPYVLTSRVYKCLQKTEFKGLLLVRIVRPSLRRRFEAS